MKQRTARRRHVSPVEGACPRCREPPRSTGGVALLIGALAISCTARPVDDTATGAANSTTSTDTITSTADPGATTALITTLPDSTTSTSTATTTSADPTTGAVMTSTGGTTEDCGAFICPPDGGTGGKDCDNWLQDCPPGEKCMPYSGDGDNSPESTKCVPVMENPGQVGEPCTVEGNGVSGIDSCDIAHMCWEVDLDTGEGTCIAFCTGSPEQPMCDPGFSCLISTESILILCIPDCDPIAQDCPGSDLCIPNPMNTERFICVLDASGEEGQEFDPCEYVNACDPGLICHDPALATECDQQAPGCCLPFCDTAMPMCNGQGAECIPWWEQGMAPPGFENVGVCGIPQ